MIAWMGASLSRRGSLEPGHFGIGREQLPALDAGPVDVRAWFARDDDPTATHRPIDLEIGSGKGTFLVRQAAACPGVNHLGLEYARAYWRHAADRLRRHGLGNARVVHAEAGAFVRHLLPPASIRQVHIYFPDPWPKKRHHKRRLVQSGFLRDLLRVLVAPGADDPDAGCVRIATDHADYFAWIEDAAAAVSEVYDRRAFVPPAAAGPGEWVGTNYERKFRQVHTVQGMILRRRAFGEDAT